MDAVRFWLVLRAYLGTLMRLQRVAAGGDDYNSDRQHMYSSQWSHSSEIIELFLQKRHRRLVHHERWRQAEEERCVRTYPLVFIRFLRSHLERKNIWCITTIFIYYIVRLLPHSVHQQQLEGLTERERIVHYARQCRIVLEFIVK